MHSQYAHNKPIFKTKRYNDLTKVDKQLIYT